MLHMLLSGLRFLDLYILFSKIYLKNWLKSAVIIQALGTEEILSSTVFRGEDVGVRPASEVLHHIGHTVQQLVCQ